MKAAVQQWGNSLAIRIPRHLAAESQVQRGSPVEIRVDEGNLVVAPIREEPTIPLAKLVRRITNRNRHGEQPVGKPVGREIW